MHVTPAQGSPLHAPSSQPFAHTVSIVMNKHFPPSQRPPDHVSSLPPVLHIGAGASLHDIPAHGSAPTHAPSRHPSGQTTSYVGYSQRSGPHPRIACLRKIAQLTHSPPPAGAHGTAHCFPASDPASDVSTSTPPSAPASSTRAGRSKS